MRQLAPALLASLVLAGCFDDPPSVDAGDEAPEQTVELRGTVTGRWGDVPSSIAGVKIDVLGTSGASAITLDDGSFELAEVPAGAPVWIAARPSATYIGTIIGIDVGYEDVDDIVLPRTSKLDVQMVADELAMQDASVVIDASMGGITASTSRMDVAVTLAPMPAGAGVYALDANGKPVLGSHASSNFLAPVVVFFDVGVHAAGELEVMAAHPEVSCTVPLAQPPVEADHVTLVAIVCG